LGAPNPNFALQIRGNRKQFWGALLMEDGRPSGGLPSLKIWERSDKKWGGGEIRGPILEFQITDNTCAILNEEDARS